MARTDQGNAQVPRHGQPQVLEEGIALGSQEGDQNQQLHYQGSEGWKDRTAPYLL